MNKRMFYIDNLRLLVIVFVVMLHAAVTYSGLGSWYYKEGAQLDVPSYVLFGFFQSFTQGYSMGFLFLIAGYFVPGAYDRKGFGRFIKDRLVRLGIPALLYMLVIHPFIVYAILGVPGETTKPAFWDFYSAYLVGLEFIGRTGPLWFAVALLIFSVIYALTRLATVRSGAKPAVDRQVSHAGVWRVILTITVTAFLIRLVQPVGTSVLNMQLCYFAQYVILFIVGIQAYRCGWFEKMSSAFGMKWFKAGLIGGALLWFVVMIGGGALNGDLEPFNGGLYWQSAAFALWESFTAVAISIGLLTLFREKYNAQNKLVKALSDNAFAVYVFHAPVLIAISLLMQPIALIPLAKFLILSVLAAAATFALAYYILRRLPVLKQVI